MIYSGEFEIILSEYLNKDMASKMGITLKEIISLVKELPEGYFEEAFEKLTEVKVKADSEKSSQPKTCPHCGSQTIVRNGKRRGKQAYICNNCDKTFTETTGSAISNSHSSPSVWKQVIRDTVDGVSIDNTALSLELHHETVFYMRHKILNCVEKHLQESLFLLEGVSEADETYVLESMKGTKIPEDYHRGPRKHGAKASKRGLSDEQICVCTSVNSEGEAMALSVNRAAPSKDELVEVFGPRIVEDTVILCDGNKNYNVFEDDCTVAHVNRTNKVNALHSAIKRRLLAACGVATKFLNRYCSLFSYVFGNAEDAVDKIFGLVTACDGSSATNAEVESIGLLDI
ncbi:MAG: IS1595 family transposase [Eubacteriaceae bacterium]|nr:IS1595 family transposase [Eubacteriaceae bacterium]